MQEYRQMAKEYSDRIEHQGTVESVDVRRGIVRVRLDSACECEGCAAAKLCGSKGEDANFLDVESKIAGAFAPGDSVVVSGTEMMHRKALMLATVLPCITLIAVMVGVYLLTFSQPAACLAGLGSMVVFFLLLWVGRKRIAREFVFSIRKNSTEI